MKTRIYTAFLLSLFCMAFYVSGAEKLDVFTMTEIPAGAYDLQLQDSGKNEAVQLDIKGNKAKFVKSSSAKFEGLSGGFELIGNGVFVARLSSKGGNITQLWLFQPDGTARIKENPDRGEKQSAKLAAR